METRTLCQALLLLLCVFLSDTSSAVEPNVEATQESRKLDYQENEILTERDTAPGNVPIVNPTTPGTTPIVNPINPLPSANTGPPATTTPTTPGPPTTTTPTMPGPPATTPTSSGGGSWCIASASASPTALQVALDYACGYGGADCSAIQPNGACYDPSTVRDHASYAFNNYYRKNPAPTSCAFGGTAQLTTTDPSRGSCRFPSSSSTPTTPPVTNPTIPMTPTMPTVPMTPPSTTTPVNPYGQGGNGFGSEPTGYDYGPTGTPSSAATISVNLVLLIIMNCILMSVAVANKF